MSQQYTKGLPTDSDPAMTADSDLLIPTQKAVRSYVGRTLASPPAIGSTTPAAGTFTALDVTGKLTAGTSVAAGQYAFSLQANNLDVITGYGPAYGAGTAFSVGAGGTVENSGSSASLRLSTNTVALGGVRYAYRADGLAAALFTLGTGIFTWQNAPAGTSGILAATAIVSGSRYTIVTVGTTDYTTVGSPDNTVGTSFVATGTPTGTGTVYLNVPFVPRMQLGSTGTLSLFQSSNTANTSVSFNTTIQNAFALDSVGSVRMGADAATFTSNTSDGADTKYLGFCGGGLYGSSRGGYFGCYGNEHATQPGNLIFGCGNVTTAFTSFVSGNNIERMRIDVSGNVFVYQGAPGTINASATLTVANLRNILLTATSTTAVEGTLPTGTDMEALYSANTNMGYDWSVINLGSASGAFTLIANTGHTIVGSAAVAIGTSGSFRSRRTGTNTWITYRLA